MDFYFSGNKSFKDFNNESFRGKISMEQQLQDSFYIQWQQHMGIHIQHIQQHKDIQHKQSEHQHQQISFHSIQDDQDQHNQDQNNHNQHMEQHIHIQLCKDIQHIQQHRGIQHIQQHKGGQPGHQPLVQLHACHSIPGSQGQVLG